MEYATRDNAWFREQFEKDVKFFQLFLLLINKSCPIRRVDVVWTEDGPAGRVGLRQKGVCTDEALASPCARLLQNKDAFEPAFCNVVNDHGRHEVETCAISDRAAERRVRETGHAEVYTCYAGLIDIAVPVFADGQHIATLFTGQVLSEPPSAAGRERIEQSLQGLAHIDWAELEKAYWQTPVVSQADIQSTVLILESFAEYLGTTWTRLSSALREQQTWNRELQLARKEFTHIVLEGGLADPAALQQLMTRLGFKRYPNRVLVAKIESESESHASGSAFDLALARAVQGAESLCEDLPDVACAHFRNRGVCVFFRNRDDGKVRSFATKLLNAAAGASGLRVKIGIGGIKANWQHLADSYQEACAALMSSSDLVAVYAPPAPGAEELSATVGQICRQIAAGQVREARAALAALSVQVRALLGDRASQISVQRDFFRYALESMSYAAGVAGQAGDLQAALARASSTIELREAFLTSGGALMEEASRIYASRPEKLVERVRRHIRQDLEDDAAAPSISISRLASSLGISSGHLSRLLKRSTGLSFERYLMAARVERAKRLLLEPLCSVSEVAERCGFSDRTYFAKVFRKLAGCSPTEYRADPGRRRQSPDDTSIVPPQPPQECQPQITH